MLASYHLKMPHAVYGGENAIEHLTEIIHKIGAKKIAMFTDRGIKETGFFALPENAVKASGAEYYVLEDLKPEPDYVAVQRLIDDFKNQGADLIVACGGGSVLDAAKLASILVTDAYGVKELLDTPEIAKKCVPIVLIPTTAGTGAEVTPNAIVAVPEKELKVGIVNENMIADYVILEARMIKNLPQKIAAATGVDALAHCINYLTVAADALIPAVAYYFGVFVLVDRLAKKRASRSGAAQDVKIQVDRKILPRLYLLVPIVVLIISILNGYSLMRSGMFGIFSCLLCNLISMIIGLKKGGNFKHDIVEGNKDSDFAGLKQLWKSCLDGAKSAAEIAVPTAACGIIINVMTAQTSLATNLSGVIASLGMTNLFPAMMIAMIGCMLLGMALPTVAAYLVGVTLFVPTMQKLGISPLVANMFVFYYGIMAQITPPVCVASYTAAGIAEADAMKTGIRGMLFALVGFLVPFVFVYNPAILLQGDILSIAWGAAQVLAATFFLAITVSGFFKHNMQWWQRVITFAAAILLITPEMITSIIGILIGVGGLLIDVMMEKSRKATI